jgi:hypothetical protein
MLKAWINSIKSTKIVKKLNTGLIKLAKTLGLKPKLFYVLIGLFVVILVALGLGARREGFSSITAANNAQTKAVQNMLAAINAATWLTPAAKTTFTTQVSTFYSTKMKFLSQGDTTINKYDIGGPAGPNVADGQVYVSNNFPDPVYDASKNALPLYVDNIATNKIDLTKYTLTSTVKNPVSQTELDNLSSAINTAIGKLSGTDQTALNTAFTALSKNADDMYEYATNPTYDPYTFDNIIDQDSDNIYEDEYDTYEFEDEQTGYDFGSLVAGSMGPSGPAGPRGPRGLTGPRGPAGPPGSVRQVVRRPAARTSTQAASTQAASTQAASTPTASASASPWGNAGAGSSGISQDNIPPGSQDMYLLKSQVVPPSNPAGAPASAQGAPGASSSGPAPANPSPTQANSCSPAPVPPCPPCERCPEPAFDCKRVPKYNSAAINQYLPQPVLADFSQFGM